MFVKIHLAFMELCNFELQINIVANTQMSVKLLKTACTFTKRTASYEME